MKKQYQYTVTLFMLVVACFYSCSSDKRTVDALYKEREYLLKEFINKSVISRGETLYQLSYYKGQFVNTFYFEKKYGVLYFTNDTIQYPINEIVAFKTVNIADSTNYKKAIRGELSRLLKIMEDFKISHVSAEDRYAGIDMKIYFGNYKALLYVSNMEKVKNERWKNYITSGTKLDDHWYNVKEE